MAQAVKMFAGIQTVMQKINLILKGFSEAFNEPMTVISVISCKNTLASVLKEKIIVPTIPKPMENQVKLSELKKVIFSDLKIMLCIWVIKLV